MTRALHICLVFVLLSTFSASAQRKSDYDETVPPASRINPEYLNQASRAAIACGADYLMARAATNYMNLVVEPAVRRSVRKAYEVRYTKKMVEHPIYKWEYEEVMVAAGGSADGDRKLVKVKRRVPGSHKQVGSKKVETLVIDPDGEIVKKYPAVDTPEFWQHALVGANALSLYALLKAGVPETDPVVAKIAEKLRQIVINYGVPDTTYDLVWLAAAFCNLKDEKFESTRKWIVNKILDGQIVDGPGRGLWGPICINSTLFAAMIGYETQLGEAIAKAKERGKKNPDSKSVARKITEAEAARDNFISQYKHVTQQGLRFEKITERYFIIPQENPDQTTAPGLYYYIYNQAVADMECTALALLAIREAHETGHLAKETWRPEVAKGKALMPPDSTSAILARCASAIARRQRSDGTWDESNIHQPLHHFKALNFKQLPKEDLFEPASKATHLSTARAYNALIDAGQAVGMTRLLSKFGRVLTPGKNAFRSRAEAYVDNKLKLLPDRYLTPYDYIFELSGIQCAPSGLIEDARDLRSRIAFRVVTLQGSDGAWGDGYKIFHSTGLLAYWDNLWRKAHEDQQAKLPADKRVPYDRELWWKRHTYWMTKSYAVEEKVVATSYCMLFLLDGVRGPVVGFVKETPLAPFPNTLGPAIRLLKEKDRFSPTCIAVTPETSPTEILGLPVLVLDSRSPLGSNKLSSLIGTYLKGDGVLIVEVMTPASLAAIETKLQSLLMGSKMLAIPRTAPFLGQYKGPELKGKALVNSKGRIAALLIPPDVGPLVYMVLKHQLGPNYFDPGYPRKTEGEHFPARTLAMNRLLGLNTPTPVTIIPSPSPDKEKDAAGTQAEEDLGLPPVQTTEKPRAADETW